MRSDSPKLLILNSAKGAVYLENGQRKIYEGTIFQDASKLTGISIVGQKRIGDAWYAYQDPEDPNTMIYIEGDGKNAKTEDNLTKIKVPLEESIEVLSFEVGETIRAENYPYWAWGSDWAFVLPLSALPEDTMLGVSTNDYVYMTANDSARALEQIIQLQNEYNGAF